MSVGTKVGGTLEGLGQEILPSSLEVAGTHTTRITPDAALSGLGLLHTRTPGTGGWPLLGCTGHSPGLLELVLGGLGSHCVLAHTGVAGGGEKEGSS